MRSRSAVLVLAVLVGLVFLLLAVKNGIYAPGAHTVQRVLAHASVAVFGEDDTDAYGVAIGLRKVYSVVAFSVVGVLVALASRRRVRARNAVLGVALLSAAIEVAQKIVSHSPESFASNLFDVFCGALGGLIGAAIVGRRRRVFRE